MGGVAVPFSCETGSEAADLTLVPYYAWDNRDAGDMQVWHRSDLP
ncbi:hypothetical protein ACFQL4_25860 [Halosimplex aquaticum]